MSGVNHNCWSTTHTYGGEDLIGAIRGALSEGRHTKNSDSDGIRLAKLAAYMESIPSWYFIYYYFRDEVLRRLQAAPKTRAEVIMEMAPGYWQHYREEAEKAEPMLDPARSRGGIHELELAIDAMAAYYNDEKIVLPVNLLNTGAAMPGFDSDLVVEVPTVVSAAGFAPIPQKRLQHQTIGIVHALAEYQVLTAEAGWRGTAADGIRALASHPLVPSLPVAEALYNEMAYAHARYLPERLIP
jgi:6-phospho-beta-glucosidase